MVSLGARKGVFYTATALVMMIVLLSSLFVYSSYREMDKSLVLQSRIQNMNDFISDIEVDVDNALYISGFRAMLSLTDYISRNQSYIDNVDARFNEAFFNGTIKGVQMDFMENNTFIEWMSRIQEQSSSMGMDVFFNDTEAHVYQEDPWTVTVNLSFMLVLGDSKGTAYWERQVFTQKKISILQFEDPMYRIETNGKFLNPIRKQDAPYFVNLVINDTSYLLKEATGSYYVAWSGAPSYLKRLKGDFSASPYGIESLVDIDELTDQGITPLDKTIVDYYYFGTQNPTTYVLTGMPSWFKLDNQTNAEGNMSHLQIYQAEGLI